MSAFVRWARQWMIDEKNVDPDRVLLQGGTVNADALSTFGSESEGSSREIDACP